MGIFKQFATNPALESGGVPIEFDANDDGTIPTVYIARQGASNKKYAKAVEAAYRPIRRKLELKTVTNEEADPILKKLFAYNIIVGWDNVQDEKNALIPFSAENALALISDPRMQDFYARLDEASKESAMFRDAALDDEAKN